MDKTNLILNSTIELVDVQEEGNGKGRPFISRFLEPGIAHYKELGDILITKETLNKFIHTMVGCPVIIEHEDVTDENADKLRVGVVSRVWFNEMDGYFYCEGILTDPEAIDLVKNQGYNVSCAYSFVSDNTKKTHNGKEIDMEFIDGEFLHLALVKDPRYEGANIVVNKQEETDNDGRWITVKGTHVFVKKGQSVDEAMGEAFGKKGEQLTSQQIAHRKGGLLSKIDRAQRVGLKDEEKKLRDRYDKLRAQEAEISKEAEALKGKYTKEDAEFDEEQAKKDIAVVQRYGYEDIDSIADYLGLDPDEVIALTGEGYEDEDEQSDSKGKSGDGEEGGSKQSASKVDYSVGDNIKFDTNWRGVNEKISEGAIIGKEKKLGTKDDPNPDYQYKVKTSDGKTILVEKEAIKEKQDKNVKNNIGDITMTVLNDLTDFIKKVVKNEKDEETKEVKNEDKRKLIDEVGGILKGKVDEELWRTVVGKLEKVAYEPSEDSEADNEDDEEKEAKNKCKNEDDEKEEDVTENEDEEDKKEDKAENKKVKNSMKDIVMGGSSQAQAQKLYTSRKERLEEGNKY